MRSHMYDLITKECVLFEVEKTFNVVGVNGFLDLKQNSPLVLCIDQALRHGLCDPVRGYWQLVRDLTHSTTLKALDACLKYVSSSHQKGLLWIYYTLDEGSLEHYIASLLQDVKSLKSHYRDKSLLRDPLLSQRLISTISNLRAIAAQMDSLTSSVISTESTTSENESNLLNQTTQDDQLLAARLNCQLNSLLELHLTTSSTPCLTSPVDSGVALLDSDVEGTSVSDGLLENYRIEDDLQNPEIDGNNIMWTDSSRLQPDSVASSVLTQICSTSPIANGSFIDNNFKSEIKETDNMNTAVNSEDVNKNSTVNSKQCDNKKQQTKPEKNKILKENVVYRRSRKKKSNKDMSSIKRVSFHEDSAADSQPFSTPKKGYVQGRYSWCAEGDSPFVTEKENFRSNIKSEILERKGSITMLSLSDSEMGIEADCGSSSSSTLDENKSNLGSVCQKLNDVVKQSLGIITKKVIVDSDHYNSSLSSSTSKEDSLLNVSTVRYKALSSQNPVSKMLNSRKGLPERGTPEGQEDPCRSISNVLQDYERILMNSRGKFGSGMCSVDWSSDSEWSSEIDERLRRTGGMPFRSMNPRRGWPLRILNEASSKTSLVNRFLRSIPEPKLVPKKNSLPKPVLYIKGAKPVPSLNAQVLELLSKEMVENQSPERKQGEYITSELKSALQKSVLVDKNENVYKVYRVSSLDGLPLLAILTNKHLYLTGLNTMCNKYCNHHVISLQYLDTVIIGPNSQTLMLVAIERSYNFTVISALGEDMVSDLIAHLELSMRRLGLLQLSIRTLQLGDMASLWKSIIRQTAIDKTEQLVDYMWVRLGDTLQPPQCSPLGPSKTGYLMYKPFRNSAWIPGYIILKGGVVYVFSDTKQRLPKHALSLHWDQCGGCRRVLNCDRPHAFEILPSSFRSHNLPIHSSPRLSFSCAEYPSFQLAAADDYEASDWLQAIVQSASSMSDTDVILQEETSESVIGCELLLTTNHMLTLEFPDRVLSCENLNNITCIKVATTCCVLETGCREIHEGGGDWVIYFLTEQLLSHFLRKLLNLRPKLKDMVLELSNYESLHCQCEQTSIQIRNAWEPLLNPNVSSFVGLL